MGRVLCVGIWGAVVGISLAGIWWLHDYGTAATNAAKPANARRLGQPMPVRTTLVSHSRVEEVIGATAVTSPSETVSIRVNGNLGESFPDATVKGVHAWEGARVSKGQLLFELDEELFSEALKQRQVAFESAREKLQILEQLQLKGVSNLFEVGEARETFETARLNLELGRRDIQRCKIRSPIDGFVGTVEVVAGESAEASESLTEVHKLDPIHVRVDYPQERIGDVVVGQTATVVLDCFPQETFTGTVVRIAPEVDPETRVLAVVVEISNREHRIKAGVSGFVRLPVNRDATTVPAAAVIEQDSKAMVFAVEEGRARIREVRTGPVVETGVVEIRGGLAPGEEVVIFGHESLRDNDLVNADWRSWARREPIEQVDQPVASAADADVAFATHTDRQEKADDSSSVGGN